MSIERIKNHVPHRYPFLLLDKIVHEEAGKELTAIKNVSINEPIFQGHFPEMAIFPGVLIVEAMAQASGILASITAGSKAVENEDLYFLAGVDKAKFKKPVIPGDQIKIKVEFIQEKHDYAVFKTKGVATVDDEVVCTAEILCAKKRKTS